MFLFFCMRVIIFPFVISHLVKIFTGDAIYVYMDNVPLDISQPAIKLLSFCQKCVDPEEQGSFVTGLAPKLGIKEYNIKGELIYGVPNFGEIDNMLNRLEFKERIVMVKRGKVSLQIKAINIQRGGAIGLIIVDDGKCNEEFTQCGPMAGSVQDGGFAPSDKESVWNKIKIPVLLITQQSAQKLWPFMDISKIMIPNYGLQNITPEIVMEEDEL